MASSSAMQREVIRWLQTLELSCGLKNPRRELMSGFVVAEILSRFDKNLSLHSFDVGSALARRLDNWNQIEKYLKAKQCREITSDDVRNTMMGSQGAANEMLEKLYTFITKKALKPNAPVADKVQQQEAARPAFMRPTAAELVRLQNTVSAQILSKLTGKTDEKNLVESNAAVVQKQREFNFQDRMQNHGRYERQKIPMKNLIAIVKGKHDGISIPTSGPGVLDGGDGTAASRSIGGGGGAGSPRTRQRMQQARQLALKTHNQDLVDAFQQRQQHERDEVFRHQFDPDEDIGRAFSRVVARPLQQSGHFSVALELGIGSDIVMKHELEKLTAVDVAPSSPTFPRVDVISAILGPDAEQNFPDVVIDACFEQLLSTSVKQNAARLLQQRPDDVVHMILLIDLTLNTKNVDNITRLLHVFEEIGQQVTRLDPTGRAFGIRDELIAGLCPRVGDFVGNLAAEDHRRALTSAFCKMLLAFSNLRDSDSIKKLLELVVKHTAPSAIRGAVEAMIAATVFHSLSENELRVTGVESIAVFHASSLIHRSSPREVACGWEIFRCIAPISSTSAATAIHFASQLALANANTNTNNTNSLALPSSSSSSSNVVGSSREKWETQLLALLTCIASANAHYVQWSETEEGVELLDLTEVTAVRLLEGLLSNNNNQKPAATLEIRAVFCSVAPLLRSDIIPSVAVVFVQKFLSDLSYAERDELLRQPQTAMDAIPALASCTGKAESYGAGALSGSWPIDELLVIVRILYNSLSSLHVVEMMYSLLITSTSSSSAIMSSTKNNNNSNNGLIDANGLGLANEDENNNNEESENHNNNNNNTVSGSSSSPLPPQLAVQESNRQAWEETLRYTKADLVNAVRNPVELRDVSDADLPRCQALASQVLSALFQFFSSSNNNDSNDNHFNNDNDMMMNHNNEDDEDEDDQQDDDDEDYNTNNNHGDDYHHYHHNDSEGYNSPGSDSAANNHTQNNTGGIRRKNLPFGAVDWVAGL